MSTEMSDAEYEKLTKSRQEDKSDYLNSSTKDVFDKSFFEDDLREDNQFIGRKSVLIQNKKTKKKGKNNVLIFRNYQKRC